MLLYIHELYSSRRYIAFLTLEEILLPAANEPITSTIHRAMTSHPQAGAFLFKTSFHWTDKQPIAQSLATLLSDVENDVELKKSRLIDFQLQKNVYGSDAELKNARSAVSTDRVITMGFNEIEDVADDRFSSVLLADDAFAAVHTFKGVCQSFFDFIECDRMAQTMRKREEVARLKHEVVKNVDLVEKHMKML